MIEEWKDVTGYEGYYEVSNLGRVRSLDRDTEIRQGVFITHKGRILKSKENKFGYPTVALSVKGAVKYKFVHRLVAGSFISPHLEGFQVNHIDGNKRNNRFDNLEWCTPSENIQHAFDTKLREGYKGEKHPSSKLSDTETEFIRYWLDKGEKGVTMAKLFKVSKSTISEIRTGKRRPK